MYIVQGCDGSVLLDVPSSEKENGANKGSLRGVEVIDAAKAELELLCPNTVSCADIIAFAARDSVFRAGGMNYAVPSGRRDGRVSSMDEPNAHLPTPFSNVTQLIQSFARKGLSPDEMVTLTGAHSIGRSHCSFITNRLYPTVDPTLDPTYAAFLKRTCPPPETLPPGVNPTVNLDYLTPNLLDNSFYSRLINRHVVFSSDQALLTSPLTAPSVAYNAIHSAAWANKFMAAMVKMGKIGVLTGNQGEIRQHCRVVN